MWVKNAEIHTRYFRQLAQYEVFSLLFEVRSSLSDLITSSKIDLFSHTLFSRY